MIIQNSKYKDNIIPYLFECYHRVFQLEHNSDAIQIQSYISTYLGQLIASPSNFGLSFPQETISKAILEYYENTDENELLSLLNNFIVSSDNDEQTLSLVFGYLFYIMNTQNKVNQTFYKCDTIRKNISINVDKKTAVISITVEAQDALICKTVADSVKERLQVFITNYRTNKSRIDELYYKKLVDEAKEDYEKARRIYAGYADSNMDIMLESIRAKQNDLENDMQLKYNTYTTLMTQYQTAKAKVQERTPAFTIVKGASMPIKPSGPKRLIFVLGMVVVVFVFLCIYSVIDLIIKE